MNAWQESIALGGKTTSASPKATTPPATRIHDELHARCLALDEECRLTVSARGKVTVVRWWTNGCSLCSGSVPALTELAKKATLVSVYHPKPPRELGADEPVGRELPH